MEQALKNNKQNLKNLQRYMLKYWFTTPAGGGMKVTSTQKEKNKVKKEGFKCIFFEGDEHTIDFLQDNGRVLNNKDFEEKIKKLDKSFMDFLKENM